MLVRNNRLAREKGQEELRKTPHEKMWETVEKGELLSLSFLSF